MNFAWTIEEFDKKIPVLPKNIAKNFMETFFKNFGYVSTVALGRCVLHKVRDTFSYFRFF